MDMNQLAPNLFVAAQIEVEDLTTLVRDGFTDVVCNRPDEEHPGSATSLELSSVADRLGISFHYDPIRPGEPFIEQARNLGRLTARPEAKIFAYCRSGTRSSNAWTLASSGSAETAPKS